MTDLELLKNHLDIARYLADKPGDVQQLANERVNFLRRYYPEYKLSVSQFRTQKENAWAAAIRAVREGNVVEMTDSQDPDIICFSCHRLNCSRNPYRVSGEYFLNTY